VRRGFRMATPAFVSGELGTTLKQTWAVNTVGVCVCVRVCVCVKVLSLCHAHCTDPARSTTVRRLLRWSRPCAACCPPLIATSTLPM
jgi:hypothetical protein